MYSDTETENSQSTNSEESILEEIIGIEFDDSDTNSETTTQNNSLSSFLEYSFHDFIDQYDMFEEQNLIEESARIYLEDQEFVDSEKENKKYYIGSAVLLRRRYVMNTAITPETFFKYSYPGILYYLYESSLFYFVRNRLEIMQLYIHPVTTEYIVVLKTFWLSIIQRTWRRVLKERAAILKLRGHPNNLKYREVYGRNKPNLNVLPSLYGMLSRPAVSFLKSQ